MEVWILYSIYDYEVDEIHGYVTSKQDAYRWLQNYILDSYEKEEAEKLLKELESNSYDHFIECRVCVASKLSDITPPLLRA